MVLSLVRVQMGSSDLEIEAERSQMRSRKETPWNAAQLGEMKRWWMKDRRRVVAGRWLLARPDSGGRWRSPRRCWAGGRASGTRTDARRCSVGRGDTRMALRAREQLKHTHTVFSLVVAPQQCVVLLRAIIRIERAVCSNRRAHNAPGQVDGRGRVCLC